MISNSIKSSSLSGKKGEIRKKGPNDVRSGRVVDGQKKPEVKHFGPKKGPRIAVVKGRLEIVER